MILVRHTIIIMIPITVVAIDSNNNFINMIENYNNNNNYMNNNNQSNT